jgi:hypothetical protein
MRESAQHSASVLARPRAAEPWLPVKALTNVLFLAAAVGLVAALWVFVSLDGWTYYQTPLRVRGYAKAHHLLRPSGSAGHLLGIVGFGIVTLTLLYTLRKHWAPLRKIGTAKGWLEAHIFCGLLGPILITLHTSFKFNGIISVAYWSMALVVGSGFVGRYLFVRIPKTLRGTEVSLQELEARAAELKATLADATLSIKLLRRIEAFESEALPPRQAEPGYAAALFGGFSFRRRLARLRREIAASGMAPEMLHDALDIVSERAELLRRIAFLDRTKKLFSLWHVVHKPLVWVMFGIGALHVALALYMGYSFVRF